MLLLGSVFYYSGFLLLTIVQVHLIFYFVQFNYTTHPNIKYSHRSIGFKFIFFERCKRNFNVYGRYNMLTMFVLRKSEVLRKVLLWGFPSKYCIICGFTTGLRLQLNTTQTNILSLFIHEIGKCILELDPLHWHMQCNIVRFTVSIFRCVFCSTEALSK